MRVRRCNFDGGGKSAINYTGTVAARDEFGRYDNDNISDKSVELDRFVTRVLNEQKFFVKGNENELAKLLEDKAD